MATGYWLPGYLWSIPLLLLHFAIIYSLSALLAVSTRNTVVCILGSILIWSLCVAVNYGRHAARILPESSAGVAAASTQFNGALEVAYWLLPKPTDLVLLLDRLIGAEQHFHPIFPHATFQPALSILTSLLFATSLLAIAAREVVLIDY